MAKKKVTGKRAVRKSSAKGVSARRAAKRSKSKRVARPKAARTPHAGPAARKKTASVRRRAVKRPTPPGRSPRTVHRRPAGLERVRRVLDETVPTPPSSLNIDRHGSAARTGRAEMAEAMADHATLTPAITGGDVDVNVENAYFTGDEAPGGDNPTPDQDVVDEIGKALGVEYQDSEELRGSDKVAARDKHRWELDPASAEDYKERKP